MTSLPAAFERTWYAIAPGSAGEGPVTFQVCLPKQELGGGWSVEVILEGIEANPGKILGEDGWQAMAPGMRFVAARVADFSDRGWQFFWSKGESPQV